MQFRDGLLAIALLCLQILPLTAQADNNRWNANYAPQPLISGQESLIANTSPAVRYIPTVSDDLESQDFNDAWQSLRTFRLMNTLDKPLKVYVESHAAETSLYKEQYLSYVQEAMQAWSTALDGRLRYQMTENPAEAQIKVYWVAGFTESDQAGLTDSNIGRASIRIKTVGLPENLIRGNIMHEMGHALGIEGHSPVNNDIMTEERDWTSYDQYKNYKPTLSQRDILAIQRLYGPDWRQGEDLYQAIRQSDTMVSIKH